MIGIFVWIVLGLMICVPAAYVKAKEWADYPLWLLMGFGVWMIAGAALKLIWWFIGWQVGFGPLGAE